VGGPREVTDQLRLPAPSSVIARKTLHEDISGYARLATCWYPEGFAETAALLLEPEPVPGGVARYLEDATGRSLTVVRESIGARLATDDERRHLTLRHPAAVLVVRRLGLDAQGVPLEYRETVHPPGRWIMPHENFTSSTADSRR
jgi:DNA-binding GntR family transcriptional regulator